jgi:hypothetical protein
MVLLRSPVRFTSDFPLRSGRDRRSRKNRCSFIYLLKNKELVEAIPYRNCKGGCRMNRILILSLLLFANLSAEPSIANEENSNCIESLSAAQFLTAFGVGTLTAVGGMIAGGLVADQVFPDNFGGYIFLTGLTGSFAGGLGIIGTWMFFCDRNKKSYLAFKISPNTVASQWVFNF